MELIKWDRINRLMGYYGQLLTERQQTMMRLYYEEDYSLGEIADRHEISRQAVHDNLNRASQQLEEYEATLHLLARSQRRLDLLRACQEAQASQADDQVTALLDQLIHLEE